MIYRRLRRFREAFANLPSHIQAAAVKAFRLFQENPNHPSFPLPFARAASILFGVAGREKTRDLQAA